MRERFSWCLPLHKRNRSHYEIIASILEAVKDESLSRFSILKHASINHIQLKKYLIPLVEKGLVRMEVRNGRMVYRTSEKGLAFLMQYHALRELLSSSRTHSYSKMMIQVVPHSES